MTDSTPTRPNVLLIVCDQLRADHTGFGGSDIIRTPVMDRLANGGVVFDRAHVANTICMPNRVSLLTGRAPSAHGVLANNASLNWSTNTFVRGLRHAGYRTALIGKADLQNGLRRLFEAQPEGPAPLGDPYPKGWDSWEDIGRFTDDDFSDPDDFYGFEKIALTMGHGDMVGGHHLRWALEQGATLEALRASGPGNALHVSDHWWQVYKPALAEELYSTTFVTETTCDTIDEYAKSGSPWFLEASFPDPHHPFTAPGRWFDRHSSDEFDLPETFADDLSNAPSHYGLFRSLEQNENLVRMFGPTEGEYRDAAAAEAGAIEFIDHSIGTILDAVARSGQTDNTIVIFTADHGDMFGDHGLMLKGMMQFEGCTKVPLVINAPACSGAGRTASMASTLDIAPTILDLTGVDGYEGLQGHSLRPVLDDPAESVRDEIYIEEDFPQAKLFPIPIPHRVRTLITESHRISRFVGTGEMECYDLENDPLERENRQADASTRPLIERLLDAVAEHAEPPRVGALVDES